MNQIVQTELIQSIIGLSRLIMVKFQLQTVSLTAHHTHIGKRRISLAADSDVVQPFAVNDDGTAEIVFTLTIVEKFLPGIHQNIQIMYAGHVKQPLFIS